MTEEVLDVYPRRILLAITGMSPQVVTETVYAQSLFPGAVLPTEIHVVTTEPGAERVRLSLLHSDTGWFHRLCADYGLTDIHFDESHIHRLTDRSGNVLDDIVTESDNSDAADLITTLIREFTADADTSLHVSIAGGRKTMGFFAGYALSLFGRKQDRLSHVLVSPPYESHPDFYYPTPYSSVIYTNTPERRPIDTKDAEVTLANIPFVRLRSGLPERLQSGRGAYHEAVEAAQLSVGSPELELDLATHQVNAGGVRVSFSPVERTFYIWLAMRRKEGLEALACPRDGVPEQGYAEDFLDVYRQVIGAMGDDDRVTHALKHGMEKNYFERRKSDVNRKLRQQLGRNAELYEINRLGSRSNWTHGLTISPEEIRITNR